MMHRWIASALVLGCGAVFALDAVRGEDIHWRKSYAEARTEAATKNKLLLLDFGTEDCHWCKRLDVETFRDPGVQALLNEQFVTYKVDAQRDARLLTALHIQSYPTLVFAASDGKILGVQEGYIEAARFRDQLRQAVALNATPEAMQRDFDEAAKAVAASDFSRAIALLKDVTRDGKDRPIQTKARSLLQDLEQHAAARLVSARRLADQGLKNEAIAAAGDVSRSYAGTQAAKEAAPLLAAWSASPETPPQPHSGRARELLIRAREDYRARQYLACLDHCELITTLYADSIEGPEAARMAAEIRSNPEWMKLACDTLEERLSLQLLALAESHVRKGQPREAVACLERVAQMFPGTRQAEAARTRLSQIAGEPARAEPIRP